MSTPVERPSLGIIPRHLWLAQVEKDRLNQLQEAMIRYIKTAAKLPQEWIEEYNEIIKRRNT